MATDPAGLRHDAPILDAWLRFHEEQVHPFTIPGHKHNRDIVGDVIVGDVPLYAGLDTMKLTRGVLADGEERAARLWGADRCRFSVGGSTHGNQALALALCRPGDVVVVGRTLHRSMLLGLVLSGAVPLWMRPRIDATTGLPAGYVAEDLSLLLDAHPEAVSVFVGEPSYVGTAGDVTGLAEVAHEHDVPLVVDQAWGAHFGFHEAYPPHALAAGADAMVISAHKTLPAWSQAAMVLTRDERIDPARLDAAFEATHTTSPAGAILASTDASRALLARDGERLLGEVAARVAALRDRIRAAGVLVLEGPGVDPAKLTLVLPSSGVDGIAVEADLLGAGLPVEMADRDILVAIPSIADTAARIEAFGEVLMASLARHAGSPRQTTGAGVWVVDPVMGCSPREAFFADREEVPVSRALGRISAELVAPYPPGVPLIAPGEVVTADVLAALDEARAAGARIAYAADPTGQSLGVLASVDAHRPAPLSATEVLG